MKCFFTLYNHNNNNKMQIHKPTPPFNKSEFIILLDKCNSDKINKASNMIELFSYINRYDIDPTAPVNVEKLYNTIVL